MNVMDSAQPRADHSYILTWPVVMLLLVVLATFLIKPLMFVHVFSAPLKLTELTKLLYRAELSVLGTFSKYDAIKDSEFLLLRVQQIQGNVISDYYKENRDFRLLSEFLEPSMSLLYTAKKVSDSEVGKMSLFMATISSCLNDQVRTQSYLGIAKARGMTTDDPALLTRKCQ